MAFAVAAFAAPALAAGLGRIICVGDSITEANATRPAGDGNWSWRYSCWQNFVDFRVTHEFVGTRTTNYPNQSSVYPAYLGQSFLNRHEAIWGTMLLERLSSAPTYLTNLKNLGKTPDTAVILGGCNDVVDLSVSATTVRDRFKGIVDQLQGHAGTAGNPNIRIVLVSILPRFNGTTPDFRNGRFSEINALLGPLAVAATTATSPVVYLDVFTMFNDPARFYDGAHPNGYGEQLLGNAIFAALVPDMPPVLLRIDSIDQAARTVNFLVRAHGPRNVRIMASPGLTPGTWTNLVPSALNPGEWASVPYVHPTTLPSSWFFRAEGL